MVVVVEPVRSWDDHRAVEAGRSVRAAPDAACQAAARGGQDPQDYGHGQRDRCIGTRKTLLRIPWNR